LPKKTAPHFSFCTSPSQTPSTNNKQQHPEIREEKQAKTQALLCLVAFAADPREN
jgi:hypothetical protein